MTEMACQFGQDGRLVGVLSWPESSLRSEHALVLVSAGFTAKPGPFRLYTSLARKIAKQGMPALRFDLGGIGNSQIHLPGMPLCERTQRDIRSAIDYLQASRNVNKFIIGGLCSGAEDAFRYAEIDPRVEGVVLIDPYAYVTPMWWYHRYVSRQFLNRIIYRMLRTFRLVKSVSCSDEQDPVQKIDGELIDYKYIDRSEARRINLKLIERNTRQHYVYTGGRRNVFNHRRQFASMFPGIDFADTLTVDYLPHIEHVQVFRQDRDELMALITERLSDQYLVRDDCMSVHEPDGPIPA